MSFLPVNLFHGNCFSCDFFPLLYILCSVTQFTSPAAFSFPRSAPSAVVAEPLAALISPSTDSSTRSPAWTDRTLTEQTWCIGRALTLETGYLLYRQDMYRQTWSLLCIVQQECLLWWEDVYCTDKMLTVQTRCLLHRQDAYCTDKMLTAQTRCLLHRQDAYCTDCNAYCTDKMLTAQTVMLTAQTRCLLHRQDAYCIDKMLTA